MPTKNSSLWEKEYSSKGIPSSFRQEPTQIVVDFIDYLNQVEFKGKTALDIGCGKGRNAFYLAQNNYSVTCLDFVESNCEEINQRAINSNESVRAYCQSATDPWPLSSSCDIAMDIFCYKHIVCKNEQRLYRNYLKKWLKKDGYYLLSLAAEDDGFYGPLLSSSPDISQKLVIDPYTNIGSFLYSMDDIIEEFSDTLHLVHAKKVQSVSPMHGKEYTRQVLNLLFQNKS